MRLIDKYIIYSSVFALFTEAFTFHFIIDLKLYYIILITNLLILSINKKITIHKNLLIILFLLIIHGIISYIIINNPIQSLIAQIIGVSISSIFYHNLINYYKVKKLFEIYLNFAFYISIISVLTFYFNINSFDSGRLNGIMNEPAHYAVIMLPAVYFLFIKKRFFELIIVLITVLLTKSSIGYLGIIFVLIIPLIKMRFFIKYSWIVLILVSCGIFYISTKWNDTSGEHENVVVRKIKETGESFNTIFNGSFRKNTNLSSYALLSNTFITKEILFHKPLGAGLGSYKHEYEKYYPMLKPPIYLANSTLSKINKTDANSLFLRLFADLGLFAIFLIAFFVYRSLKLFQLDNRTPQQGTFFYLILKLIREGHYFPPEFYFFLLIFLKNTDEDTTHN